MRFSLPQNTMRRVACRFLATAVATALLATIGTNAANAAAPAWMGGLFKSKRAAKQPSTVDVPNLTPSLEGHANSIPAVSAQVQAAAQRAAAESQRIREAAKGALPSTLAQPNSVRNQTNDQYLAGLLQKAQATPKAKGQFASKFPELRAEYRRMKQPKRTATDMNGLASWLANGTAAITQRTSPQQTAPQQTAQKENATVATVAAVDTKPNNRKIPVTATDSDTVRVQHEGSISAPTAANASEWSNASTSMSPADEAVAQALAGVQTEFADPEPVVPEEYRNVKLPGLPDDAKIMSIQDRVVTPAAIPPGSDPLITSSMDASPSASTQFAMPSTTINHPPAAAMSASVQGTMQSPLTQADIEQLVPQVIGPNYVPQQMTASTPSLPPHTPMVSSQVIGGSLTAHPSPTRMSTHTIRTGSPQTVMAMAPQSGQIATPMVAMQSAVGSQVRVAPPAPQFVTSTLPNGIKMTIPADGKTAVHLTPEQIKNLPVGTRLIPANAAAVRALTGRPAPTNRTATNLAAQQRAAMLPQSSASAAQLAAERGKLAAARRALAAVELQAAQAEAKLQATQLQAARLQLAQMQPSSDSEIQRTQAIQIPAGQSATNRANADLPIPSAAAANSLVPATQTNTATESSLVKDRLNRAFELCRTNPAAAEKEFVGVLRYIAKAHDEADGLNTYVAALDRGLLTLREAEQVQTELNDRGEDAAVKLSHSMRSEVSQSFSNGNIATVDLMDSYHLYARHSMMIAIGEQPLGSQALYGWGQLCSSRAQKEGYDKAVERGKAVSLLTAALDADKTNWRVHNELGVVHARNGEYVKSEKALRRSLAIEPRPETYSNIAMVMEQQGNPTRASEARNQAEEVYANTDRSPRDVIPRATTAQVAAEQPVKSNRREKVQAFVDRLMGNDGSKTPKGYEDDGIPISE